MGAGRGGETLSEVLFPSDLWAGPGISSVFSWADWRGCRNKTQRGECECVGEL